MKEVSIYHNHNMFIQLTEEITDYHKTDPQEERKVMKEYYLQILYSIYKYGALNKTNIENCLNFKNRSSWKSKSLKKALKTLRKKGYIRAYGTKEFPSDKSFAVVIYVVTRKGGLFLESSNKTIDYDRIYNPEEMKKETVLEQASIAQYHISLIKNYGNLFVKSSFNSYKTSTGELCPSVVTFARESTILNNELKKRLFQLIAFPAPKKEDELESFLGKILRVINAEVENLQITKLIIIVCEHNAAAAYIAWNLNKYRQLRPFPVLYIQDMVTVTEDPLSNVLSCETDQEGIISTNINFFK